MFQIDIVCVFWIVESNVTGVVTNLARGVIIVVEMVLGSELAALAMFVCVGGCCCDGRAGGGGG